MECWGVCVSVHGVKISQPRGAGGVLLCRSKKQVFIVTRRGEAVLERNRNQRSVSEVLLLCSFFFPVSKTAMQISLF